MGVRVAMRAGPRDLLRLLLWDSLRRHRHAQSQDAAALLAWVLGHTLQSGHCGAPAMSFPPGSRFGAYEIVSAIGRGGMGEVYRARDTRLAREIALKMLPYAEASDLEWRIRFEREARALASRQAGRADARVTIQPTTGLPSRGSPEDGHV
jgi:hypothetical protein